MTSETTDEQLMTEAETLASQLYRAGYAGNPDRLREELWRHTRDFRDRVRALLRWPGDPEWHPTRLRLDLNLDASGIVQPGVSVGGDVKIRLEWFRGREKNPVARDQGRRSPVTERALDPQALEFGRIAAGLGRAVSDVMRDIPADKGFVPFVYRTGIGVTASGSIGVVSAGATLLAQVMYTRAVPAPQVNPAPAALLRNRAALDSEFVPFRNGLRRAMTFTLRLADRISRLEKTNRSGRNEAVASSKGRWKLFELRTGFDLTLRGTVGAVGVTGMGTAGVGLYNMNF